ncbi:hypothetical protein [Burkholderia thailandensis]|uniref:hypothetical protein n=1 Tax=Burkholderia thailandensis TaxID=57975 RepID=UPI0003EC6FC8|nr:hypothetical protein [Burkholderia thailandensis]AHI63403.1 hypothetical protein BTL_2476 [Burkholderia thailandensis H0587]AOJ51302.1 hypothetical protein AQ475_11115 [Burkholderia thailandensis]AVR26743.1 hypothetical protein A8H32_18340 [Burkholderia thailandensis]TGB34414.1 hypothetical protein C6946_07235 [Burkholderia thailandensis]
MKPLSFHLDPIALPSFHTPRAAARERSAPNRVRAAPADYRVLMSIRVGTDNLPRVRRLLHQVLGAALDIYTAVIDTKTGQACLQLELARTSVPDAMSSIMRALPEAEFGPIRRAPQALAPRATRMRTSGSPPVERAESQPNARVTHQPFDA